MDENKRKMLKEINYEVHKACGLCEHFVLAKEGQMFGSCARFGYSHLKHTEDISRLSVTAFGSCPQWIPSQRRQTRLHGFVEFIKEK